MTWKNKLQNTTNCTAIACTSFALLLYDSRAYIGYFLSEFIQRIGGAYIFSGLSIHTKLKMHSFTSYKNSDGWVSTFADM